MRKIQISGVMPDDDNDWAVIADGALLYEEGNPQIRKQLIIVPLVGHSRNANPPVWPIKHLRHDRHKIVTIPIGLQHEFELGSVWHGDEQIGMMELESKIIDVIYNEDSMRVVSAGLSRTKNGKDRFLIPPHIYPLAVLAPHSKLIALSARNYPYRYLLPSTVLNVFYFGGSSELCQAIYSPGIGYPNNPVWDDARSYVDADDVAYIYLQTGIPFEDRRIVAGMFSSYGRVQAARLYTSTLEEPRGYAWTFPPFTGEETLEVEGITINAGKFTRFLILRIRKGSLPLAYPRVVIENPQFAKVEIYDTGSTLSNDYEATLPTGLPGPINVVVDGKSTSTGARQVTITRLGPDRFRNRVQIDRATHTVQRSSSISNLLHSAKYEESIETDLGAVGPVYPSGSLIKRKVIALRNDSNIDSSRTTFPKQRKPGREVTFSDLLEGLDLFVVKNNANYRLISLSESNTVGNETYFPLEYQGEVIKQSYLYKSTKERRQLLACLLKYSKCNFILLEAQRKVSEAFQLAILYYPDFSRIPSVADIEAISAATAKNNFVWKVPTNSLIHIRRQKHNWITDNKTKTSENFTQLFRFILDKLISQRI